MRCIQGKYPQDTDEPEEQHNLITSTYVNFYMNSHIVINSGEREKLLQTSKRFRRVIYMWIVGSFFFTFANYTDKSGESTGWCSEQMLRGLSLRIGTTHCSFTLERPLHSPTHH